MKHATGSRRNFLIIGILGGVVVLGLAIWLIVGKSAKPTATGSTPPGPGSTPPGPGSTPPGPGSTPPGPGSTPPSINTHPSPLTKPEGDNATFRVAATGATSYRWLKDGVDIGVNTPTFTRTNLQVGHQGTYNCVVSNTHGSIASNGAMLNVTPKPKIGLLDKLKGKKVYIALATQQSVNITRSVPADDPLIKFTLKLKEHEKNFSTTPFEAVQFSMGDGLNWSDPKTIVRDGEIYRFGSVLIFAKTGQGLAAGKFFPACYRPGLLHFFPGPKPDPDPIPEFVILSLGRFPAIRLPRDRLVFDDARMIVTIKPDVADEVKALLASATGLGIETNLPLILGNDTKPDMEFDLKDFARERIREGKEIADSLPARKELVALAISLFGTLKAIFEKLGQDAVVLVEYPREEKAWIEFLRMHGIDPNMKQPFFNNRTWLTGRSADLDKLVELLLKNSDPINRKKLQPILALSKPFANYTKVRDNFERVRRSNRLVVAQFVAIKQNPGLQKYFKAPIEGFAREIAVSVNKCNNLKAAGDLLNQYATIKGALDKFDFNKLQAGWLSTADLGRKWIDLKGSNGQVALFLQSSRGLFPLILFE